MISSARKLDPAIHRLENVRRDLREIGCRFAGGFRFINRFAFLAAGREEKRQHPEKRFEA